MFPMLLSLLVILQLNSLTTACRDGIDNVLDGITLGAGHLKWPSPITVNNVSVWLYDKNNQPSCHNGSPNVKSGGSCHFISGEVTVDQDLGSLDNVMVRVTADWDGSVICKDGKSDRIYLPNHFCVYPLSKYVPTEMLQLLSKKGTHTLKQFMESGRKFTPLYQVPEIGFWKGLVVNRFAGKYRFTVRFEKDGKTIANFSIPADRSKWLQLL